jgi:aminobenzoyl-glutamate utilization protein B
MRAHRVVTHGGDQPNVIPARASVWWYFRDPTAEGARTLFEQAKKIAAGAAQMTNTTWEVAVRSAVWPTRANRTMAEVTQRNIELVGMPAWTDEEQELARALQRESGAKVEGLKTAVTPLQGPSRQGASSNDCGDVSWAVPMGRLGFPSNIPNVEYHHWAAGVALATSIAHKGAVAGAKVLAASILDFALDPRLVAEARASFAQELGGITYSPLLPAGQRPPIELNRTLMESYRAALAAHHVKERPRFI